MPLSTSSAAHARSIPTRSAAWHSANGVAAAKRVPVTFADLQMSDNGFGAERGYLIPDAAKTQPNFVEGGVAGGGSTGSPHADRRSRSLAAL
jgi:hypothetical protein